MLIRRMAVLSTLLSCAVFLAGALPTAARADWTSLNGEAIASGPDYQYQPDAESDGVGGAYIAWLDASTHQVRLLRVQKDGTPAPGWPIGGLALRADAVTPNPVLSSGGPDGVDVLFPAAIRGTSHATFYLERIQGNGKVAPGWPEGGIALGPASLIPPSLVPDGQRGVFALMEPVGPDDARLVGQHVDARGRKLWGDESRTLVTDQAPFGFLAISDEEGGVLIARDAISVTGSARVLRVDGDGEIHPGWDPAGIALTDSPSSGARLVADGRGGALVSYTVHIDDPSRNSRDVFAKHILSEGSFDPAWDPNGLPIATAPREQTTVASVTDDAGGAIVFWRDARPGSRGLDIWAQRFTASGDVLWAPGGVPVVTVAGNEFPTDVVADGRGGAFLVWVDFRSESITELDLAMSRITADGTIAPGWPADGVKLTDSPGFEDGARIAYRAPFDPIVAWEANPAPDFVPDVRAERVSADGTGTGAAAAAAHGLQKASAGAPAATAPLARGVVAHGTTLELSLPADGTTEIGLFDLGGRRVASQDAGFLSAGSHSVELSLPSSLRSGLYFVQVSQAGRVWTSRLSLMR